MAQRKALAERSAMMCEAMVKRGRTWSRCWLTPVEAHHMLTTARGGRLLDRKDETYHLIHLCRGHHVMSDGADAYEGGLLIEGYVSWDKIRERPVYEGPDKYLKEKYAA